jgi:hypothetical protein
MGFSQRSPRTTQATLVVPLEGSSSSTGSGAIDSGSCRLTPRSGARALDKIPISLSRARAAQLNC